MKDGLVSEDPITMEEIRPTIFTNLFTDPSIVDAEIKGRSQYKNLSQWSMVLETSKTKERIMSMGSWVDDTQPTYIEREW